MVSTLVAMASLLSASLVQAPQEPTRPPTPVLVVSGNSEVRVDPDVATLRIGVTTQARTAIAAQDESNRRSNEFLGRVRRLIGEKGAVETGRINLFPVYTQPPVRPNEAYTPRISGYRAENTLVIRLYDFSIVGPVIDTAVEAGLNTVEAVSFGLRNDTEARVRALREAVAEATRKAQAMAEAGGVEITGIWELSENAYRVMPYEMRPMAAAAEARADVAPTPVLPGQVSVTGNVLVRYFIRQRGR